jgi:hypothetical protein
MEDVPIRDRTLILSNHETVAVNRLRKLKEMRQNVVNVLIGMTDEDIQAMALNCIGVVTEFEKEICFIKRGILR